MKMTSNYTVDGKEWGIYFPPEPEDKLLTPCDVCEILIDTEIHAEELGMCVECSNNYFSEVE
jgi:hypothetical protein